MSQDVLNIDCRLDWILLLDQGKTKWRQHEFEIIQPCSFYSFQLCFEEQVFLKNSRGYLCFKRMTYYFDYWYSHLMLKYFFLFLLFRDVWVKTVLIHCWEWNLQTSVWTFITFFFLNILDLHSAYVVKLWCCRIIHVVWTFFEATENILETLDSTPSPWSKVKENSKILWKSIKSLEFRRASFS